MTCDRPAVVGEERIKRVHDDMVEVANLSHISPWPERNLVRPPIGLPSDIIG
jgi:hypothetical protein